MKDKKYIWKALEISVASPHQRSMSSGKSHGLKVPDLPPIHYIILRDLALSYFNLLD